MATIKNSKRVDTRNFSPVQQLTYQDPWAGLGYLLASAWNKQYEDRGQDRFTVEWAKNNPEQAKAMGIDTIAHDIIAMRGGDWVKQYGVNPTDPMQTPTVNSGIIEQQLSPTQTIGGDSVLGSIGTAYNNNNGLTTENMSSGQQFTPSQVLASLQSSMMANNLTPERQQDILKNLTPVMTNAQLEQNKAKQSGLLEQLQAGNLTSNEQMGAITQLAQVNPDVAKMYYNQFAKQQDLNNRLRLANMQMQGKMSSGRGSAKNGSSDWQKEYSNNIKILDNIIKPLQEKIASGETLTETEKEQYDNAVARRNQWNNAYFNNGYASNQVGTPTPQAISTMINWGNSALETGNSDVLNNYYKMTKGLVDKYGVDNVFGKGMDKYKDLYLKAEFRATGK